MRPTPKQKTAVLVFARSANEEKNHKSFRHGVELFDALTKDTLNKVQRSKLPYFHFDERLQIGTSFGERFTNAIQTIYDLGYENVITVGNDCPQLKTHHLLSAQKALTLGKTVLGPTLDGGFYLMGLNQKNFDKALFLRLPWQRFGLLNSISKLLKTNSTNVYKLPTLNDIDVDTDVLVLTGFLRSISESILKVLRKLTAVIALVFSKNITFKNEYLTSLFYNKGSPVCPIA